MCYYTRRLEFYQSTPGSAKLPLYVTVRDMNYPGEILHGKWDGEYYVLDDGDCYTPEHLADEYAAEFTDVPPAKAIDHIVDANKMVERGES